MSQNQKFLENKDRTLRLFRKWVHQLDEMRQNALVDLGTIRKERSALVKELDDTIGSDQPLLFEAEPQTPTILAKREGMSQVLEHEAIRIVIENLDRHYISRVMWPPYTGSCETNNFRGVDEQSAACRAIDAALASCQHYHEELHAAGEKFFPDAPTGQRPRYTFLKDLADQNIHSVEDSAVVWSKGGAPEAKTVLINSRPHVILGGWEPVPDTANLAWINARPVVKKTEWTGAIADSPGPNKTYAGCMVMVDDVAHVLVGQRFTRKIVAIRAVTLKGFQNKDGKPAKPEDILDVSRDGSGTPTALIQRREGKTTVVHFLVEHSDGAFAGDWLVPLIGPRQRRMSAHESVYLSLFDLDRVIYKQMSGTMVILHGTAQWMVMAPISDWYYLKNPDDDEPGVVEIALPTVSVDKPGKGRGKADAKLSPTPKKPTGKKRKSARGVAKGDTDDSLAPGK